MSRKNHQPAAIRCAIYTRKSTEVGLEQDFNSLDAQREACLAYIQSQRHERWRCLPARYDDGALPEATWTGRRSSASWPTSKPAGSTAWSATSWIGSADLCWTSPASSASLK